MSIPSATTSRAFPLALGATVFMAVALLVVMAATLITFLLPETFASTCRIRLDRSLESSRAADPQEGDPLKYDLSLVLTELETVRSEAVLGPVIEELDLNARWGKRFAGGMELRTRESLTILRSQLESRRVGNTHLIELRVFNADPEEAASVANSIAKTYVKFAAQHSQGIQARVVDSAYPSLIPILPNKPLNIALGAVVGVVAGLGCGLLTFWIARRWRRSKPPGTNQDSPEAVTSSSGTRAHTLGSLNRRF